MSTMKVCRLAPSMYWGAATLALGCSNFKAMLILN